MRNKVSKGLSFNRLADIEKEIFLTKQEIFDSPQKLKRPVAQEVLDGLVERAKKPLIHKLDMLKTERDFILSKRESWLPKTIWNLVVPVIVSIVTALIVTKLNLD